MVLENLARRLIPIAVCVALGGVPGVARADFEAGWRAYEQGDFGTALAAWRPLAEAGDVRAQFNVGPLTTRARVSSAIPNRRSRGGPGRRKRIS